MTFGRRLRYLREKKGISQNRLAKEFKITPATLSQYESERRYPDIQTLLKFADYFEVTLDYLVGRTIENKFDKKSGTISKIIGKKVVDLIGELGPLTNEEKKLLEDIVEFIKFKRRK